MADIDDAAVLSHGKALAAQEGFTWELDHAARNGASVRGQHFLSRERQQEYLVRARSELSKDASNA